MTASFPRKRESIFFSLLLLRCAAVEASALRAAYFPLSNDGVIPAKAGIQFALLLLCAALPPFGRVTFSKPRRRHSRESGNPVCSAIALRCARLLKLPPFGRVTFSKPRRRHSRESGNPVCSAIA